MYVPSSLHKLARDESGAATLEAALALPVFFMLAFGAIGWGLLLWEQNTLQYAVEQSARCQILPFAYNGKKLCGSYAQWGVFNTFAIPGIAEDHFTERDVATSTGAKSYKSSCVDASFPNTLINIPLIQAPGSLQATYCRASQ